MKNNEEYFEKRENEVDRDLAKELGIIEVKLSNEDGLVFFAGCHCSNGNGNILQPF